MRITVTCPRCKQSMAAASKLAGSYVTCPQCNGRFWIPEDAGSGPSPPVPGGAPPGVPQALAPPAAPQSAPSSSGPLTTPIPHAPPPPDAPMAVTPHTTGPACHWHDASATSPPDTSLPGKKVARFITAEAAQSTLNLADDGRLPELQLQESTQAKSGEATGTTVHPLVLLGLISLSVVASVLLVLYEPRQDTVPRSTAKQRARQVIANEYFADEEHLKLDNPPPLEPYQTYLREAQRAYWRGDYATERQLYRKVLDLLRAEGTDFEGVTGSRTSDRRLEEQITILLSDD